MQNLNLKKIGTNFNKSTSKDISGNLELTLMSLPVLLHLFIFCYLPMLGVIIAFKDYRYDMGILASKWVGFNNFKFFFTSQDAWRITRNTVGMNVLFILIGTISAVVFALLLYEIKSKLALKSYQTIMIIPNFLSWVIVGYMVYAFLNPRYGFLNNALHNLFGMDAINWYNEPRYWPAILVLISVWKGIGIGCIIYYAGLMGIDPEYYEAAKLDGANKFQITWHISIPFITPLITIMFILALGGIFRSDFGLFYQLTMDSKMLYPTTDVIDTYVFRALKSLGDISMSSAVGLFQSIVGLVVISISNYVVKKIDPDNALF